FACSTRVAIELLPTLLPLLHRLFGFGERGRRFPFTIPCCDQTGFELFELPAKRIDLRLVARQMQAGLGGAALRLLEILSLALAQLAVVLNRLFGSRNLGADLIVASLHGIQRF